MENTYTTIKISTETKKMLDALKIIPQESYENVLKRIFRDAQWKTEK